MASFIKFISGIVILSLGITLMYISDLGIGPWDSLIFRISYLTKLSISLSSIIASIIILVFIKICFKKKFNTYTLFTSFVIGLFIDTWKVLLKGLILEEIYVRWIIFVLGVIVSSLGIVVYLGSNYPQNPIDYLTVSLGEKINIKIGVSKLITDCLLSAISLLLGGKIGVGTLILTFSVGPLVGLINKFLYSLKNYR